ncbi:hypothetical protein BDV39DRAFT_120683 [Aspergillus sergii]|uniref:Uncharacterized protein n=1 Tax=Aspergillus sergii TaxID=1034303 RepID=A0A5N6WUS9_9EURO|nr:hypothetical protein BDV39DRAFT_120683 [Aspergillus sergii]
MAALEVSGFSRIAIHSSNNCIHTVQKDEGGNNNVNKKKKRSKSCKLLSFLFSLTPSFSSFYPSLLFPFPFFFNLSIALSSLTHRNRCMTYNRSAHPRPSHPSDWRQIDISQH